MTISVRIEHVGNSKKLEILGATREGGGEHHHATLEPGQSALVTVYDWKTFAIRELDETEQAAADQVEEKPGDDAPTEIPSDGGFDTEASLDTEQSGQEAEAIADAGTEVADAGEGVEQAEKATDDAGPPRV